VPDFDLVPLKMAIRPHGPFGRSTLYRLGEEHPGLLRRIPGMRDTFVHVPTIRAIEATAEPVLGGAAIPGKAA
jgi:hypothetical protein